MSLSYQFYAWVACVFYASQLVVTKICSKHTLSNPWLFNFLSNFFILTLSIPIAVQLPLTYPSEWGNILWASLFYTLSGLLYVFAAYRVDISTMSPLFNLRTAFSAVLAALVLSEVLFPYQYILIAVMVVSGIFVTLDEKLSIHSFFKWPILTAVGAMLALALMSIFVNRACASDNFWLVTVWINIFAQVMLLATIPMFFRGIKGLNLRQLTSVFATALSLFLATLAVNRAYKENISITSAIISVPLPAMIAIALARWYPNFLEHHSFRVYACRAGASLLMFLAALGLML